MASYLSWHKLQDHNQQAADMNLSVQTGLRSCVDTVDGHSYDLAPSALTGEEQKTPWPHYVGNAAAEAVSTCGFVADNAAVGG